jgi:hypothetical protein
MDSLVKKKKFTLVLGDRVVCVGVVSRPLMRAERLGS